MFWNINKATQKLTVASLSGRKHLNPLKQGGDVSCTSTSPAAAAAAAADAAAALPAPPTTCSQVRLWLCFLPQWPASLRGSPEGSRSSSLHRESAEPSLRNSLQDDSRGVVPLFFFWSMRYVIKLGVHFSRIFFVSTQTCFYRLSLFKTVNPPAYPG